MGRQFGGKQGDCPITEDVSDRLVRLPFYNDLAESDQARVVAAVKTFDCQESCQSKAAPVNARATSDEVL
jgi:dTDP-4-amino-4,6-dideoxygalactose transaminase